MRTFQRNLWTKYPALVCTHITATLRPAISSCIQLDMYILPIRLKDTCVTVFWKTDLMVTNTKIHFSLYRNVTLMHYPETRWPVLLYRRLFSGWGAKLILTTDLA